MAGFSLNMTTCGRLLNGALPSTRAGDRPSLAFNSHIYPSNFLEGNQSNWILSALRGLGSLDPAAQETYNNANMRALQHLAHLSLLKLFTGQLDEAYSYCRGSHRAAAAE